ncbi:MAG: signal peptide peptidase SppA [Deltaproteobacteria bacterium]|jgi:protease-4|nr:signal peptide peptidase SppA [Deltaproteobacteria bacterium]
MSDDLISGPPAPESSTTAEVQTPNVDPAAAAGPAGGQTGDAAAGPSSPSRPSSPEAASPGAPARGGPPQWRNLPYRRPGPAVSPPPPKTSAKSSWLSWPLVFLILGFFVVGSCHYSLVTTVDSFRHMSADASLSGPGLGVLEIEGEIFDTRWAVDALKEFDADDNVKAVVLRIDSPGGAVAPCQELYEALKNFNKPVVVSMGSVAASGGVYLAMARGPVLANPGTLTGSIGVVMDAIEFQGAMDKLGVKSETIKSGPYKDIGSPFRAMQPQERELLQKMVMNVYEQFVRDVAAGRPKLSEAQVRKMADGRVFSGEEALKLGLIDELGGFEQAVAKAKTLGGLADVDDPPLLHYDGRPSLLQQVVSGRLPFASSIKSAFSPGFSLKFLYRPGL